MIPDTMTADELKGYLPGWECGCLASHSNECSCGANWTPKEVYELRNMVLDLEDRVAALNIELTKNAILVADQQKENNALAGQVAGLEARLANCNEKDLATELDKNDKLRKHAADLSHRLEHQRSLRIDLDHALTEKLEFIDAVGAAVALLPWDKDQRKRFWDDVHSFAEDLAKERRAVQAAIADGSYKAKYTAQEKVEEYTTQYALDA